MMVRGKKKAAGYLQEQLVQVLVPVDEQPYEVPENWVWTRLININQYDGSSVDPLKTPDKTFELYSVPSCENDYPEIVNGSEIGSTKQSVQKDDVLLCKINPRINRVWFVAKYTEHELIASSEWIVLRNNCLNAKYLVWCLTSKYFRELLLSNVSGVGGSLMRAQPKHVKKYPIPIPPLTEQQRIVDRITSMFAKLDAAMELAQSALDSFKTRKAAILHKAFIGELTVKWRNDYYNIDKLASEDIEYKLRNDLDLFCLPNTWVWVDLKFVMNEKDFCYGVIQPGDDCKNGPRLIRVCDINDGTVDIENLRGISNEINNQYKRSVVKGGEILVSVVGTIGRTVIVPKECDGFNIARAIAKIPIQDFNVKYIYYWLMSEIAQMWMIGDAREVARKTLNLAQLRTLPIPLPPLQEQQEIARILDNLFEKEQQAKDLCDVIDKIDLMKKAILVRAFRGELGTNDPAEESALELLKQVIMKEPVKNNETKLVRQKYIEVMHVYNDMLEALQLNGKKKPEELKNLLNIDVDSFYEQLKNYIDMGKICEVRKGKEVFLEANT